MGTMGNQLLTHDQDGHRGPLPCGRPVDLQPCQIRATARAPSGERLPTTAAPPHKEVGGRALLLVPIGARGDWTMPQGQDPQDQRRKVLVVRERRAAVPPPPLHEAPGMGATGQEYVKGHREGVWVEAPRSSGYGRRSNRGGPALLTGYRVGCIVTVRRPPEEDEGGDSGNEEDGPGSP